MDNTSNATKASDFIRDNAGKFADAKSQRVYLEFYRHSLRGELYIKYADKGIKGVELIKSHAESDQKYKDLLAGLEVAIREEEELRLLIKSAELKVDIWRTQQSNRRAEMQLK